MSDSVWAVSLTLSASGDSPIGAVDEYIEQLVQYNVRGYAFQVRNEETGETFLVKDGQIRTAEELLSDYAEEVGSSGGEETSSEEEG